MAPPYPAATPRKPFRRAPTVGQGRRTPRGARRRAAVLRARCLRVHRSWQFFRGDAAVCTGRARRHLAAAAEIGATAYLVRPDERPDPDPRDAAVVAALERSFDGLRELQSEAGPPAPPSSSSCTTRERRRRQSRPPAKSRPHRLRRLARHRRVCNTRSVVDDHDIGVSTGAYHGLSLGAALLRIAEIAPSAEILSLGRHSLLEPINVRVVEAAGLPFTVHGPFAHFEFGSRWASRHRARHRVAPAAHVGGRRARRPALRRPSRHAAPRPGMEPEDRGLSGARLRGAAACSRTRSACRSRSRTCRSPGSRTSSAPVTSTSGGSDSFSTPVTPTITGTLSDWLERPADGPQARASARQPGPSGRRPSRIRSARASSTSSPSSPPRAPPARASSSSTRTRPRCIASLDHLRSRGLLVRDLG